MTARRFAAGAKTQTEMLAGAYLVSDWTADNGLEWVVASTNIVTPYAIRVVGLDGHTKTQGVTSVEPWVFDVLSGTMFHYLAQTVFSSQQSINATIYTFNQKTLTWQTYQCIATLNEISGEALQPWGNVGFRGASIEFTQCNLNVE